MEFAPLSIRTPDAARAGRLANKATGEYVVYLQSVYSATLFFISRWICRNLDPRSVFAHVRNLSFPIRSCFD